jgi:hypothetical protein
LLERDEIVVDTGEILGRLGEKILKQLIHGLFFRQSWIDGECPVIKPLAGAIQN